MLFFPSVVCCFWLLSVVIFPSTVTTSEKNNTHTKKVSTGKITPQFCIATMTTMTIMTTMTNDNNDDNNNNNNNNNNHKKQ